jgi:hypothetical protein
VSLGRLTGWTHGQALPSTVGRAEFAAVLEPLREPSSAAPAAGTPAYDALVDALFGAANVDDGPVAVTADVVVVLALLARGPAAAKLRGAVRLLVLRCGSLDVVQCVCLLTTRAAVSAAPRHAGLLPCWSGRRLRSMRWPVRWMRWAGAGFEP